MLDKWRLAKTLSYRVMIVILTAIAAYLFTGSVVIAAGIIGVEVIIKMVLFYLHEYVWDTFHIKRKYKGKKNQR